LGVGGWKVKAGVGGRGGYLAIPFDAFKPPKLHSERGFSHTFQPEGCHSLLPSERLTTHLPQASGCNAAERVQLRTRDYLRAPVDWRELSDEWRESVLQGILAHKETPPPSTVIGPSK